MSTDDKITVGQPVAIAEKPVPCYKKKTVMGCICCVVLVVIVAVVLFFMRRRIFGMRLESREYDVRLNKKNDYITLAPKPENGHEYTLIFLHGAGGSSRDFFMRFARQGPPNRPEMRLTPLNCKIILPQAPKRKVTMAGPRGKPSNMWFDVIKFPNQEGKTNEELWADLNQDDLTESTEKILKIVEREVEKLGDPSKVFIGGFSQGAVTTLATFLQYKGDKPLGGFIVLAGMQALDYKNQVKFDNKKQEKAVNKMRKDTPLFGWYGEKDEVVPLAVAEPTWAYIKDEVYKGSDNFQWQTDPNGRHRWNRELDEKLKPWLREKMPAKPKDD